MEPAGDVRGRDGLHEAFIAANVVSIDRLADVTIQVEAQLRHHPYKPVQRNDRQMRFRSAKRSVQRLLLWTATGGLKHGVEAELLGSLTFG